MRRKSHVLETNNAENQNMSIQRIMRILGDSRKSEPEWRPH